MTQQVITATITILIGVAGSILYFVGTNWLLDRIFPFRDGASPNAVRNHRITTAVRPWLFLGPALLALGVYLIYPVFETLRLSLYNRDTTAFVGFDNYAWLVGDAGFRESIVNNFMWLLVVPTAATFFGLMAAVLTDRIWWGNIAKSLVFMPMAISFVGASVIWKFVYDYRAAGSEQIGILNAFVVWLGFEPQAWIAVPFWNNFFLMVILIWIQTGFAMVILSAALRGIPEETMEAAVIDGANDFQIFFHIMVPQIWGTIAVVWTTITIVVLKVFDIVFAMTNGQWNSQVLGNLMYDWMFRGFDFGRGAAIAIVIMVLVTPIMISNIRRAKAETKGH